MEKLSPCLSPISIQVLLNSFCHTTSQFFSLFAFQLSLAQVERIEDDSWQMA